MRPDRFAQLQRGSMTTKELPPEQEERECYRSTSTESGNYGTWTHRNPGSIREAATFEDCSSRRWKGEDARIQGVPQANADCGNRDGCFNVLCFAKILSGLEINSLPPIRASPFAMNIVHAWLPSVVVRPACPLLSVPSKPARGESGATATTDCPEAPAPQTHPRISR
jgi:hypothetical protein